MSYCLKEVENRKILQQIEDLADLDHIRVFIDNISKYKSIVEDLALIHYNIVGRDKCELMLELSKLFLLEKPLFSSL